MDKRERRSYINSTGYDQVVTNISISISAASYPKGAAAMDFCVNIIPAGLGNQPKLRNGIETLCGHLVKSNTDTDWPKQEWTIQFPGQGLILPKDNTFACSAQGSLYVRDNRPVLSDFTCVAFIKKLDTNSNIAPVQSLRTPYIDRRFTALGSGFHPQLNQSTESSTVRGFWMFAGGADGGSSRRKICMYQKQKGVEWQNNCFDLNLGNVNSYASPSNFFNYQYSFNSGDQIAINCSVDNPDNSIINNCAFYLMVDVPKVNGLFKPFALNTTIAPGQSNSFCNLPIERYMFTFALYNQDRNQCIAALQP